MEKSPNHNDQESSRSSSSTDQEVDQPADNMAAGRSYECVFCKRGFTTAQALGGHMNIHRKDRAKSNRSPAAGPVPTSIHPNNHQYPQMNYHTGNKIYSQTGAGGYVPLPFDYYSFAAAAHEPQHGNYRMHYPASTSDGGPMIRQQLGDHDGRTSLNLQYGGSGRRDGEEEEDEEEEEQEKGMNRGGVEDEDGVDLELRLGYNP